MFEDYYMTADDVAKALKISKSFAYKVIRKMNAELQEQGFFTMAGKVNKQFFLDKTCYDAAKVKEAYLWIYRQTKELMFQNLLNFNS